MKRMWFAWMLLVCLIVTGVGQAAELQGYWQRMAHGFPNQVVVYEQVYQLDSPTLELNMMVPQLVGAEPSWQEEFNALLREEAQTWVDTLREFAQEGVPEWSGSYVGWMEYEVKLNQGGLLSLVVTTYTFTGGAHGMTYRDYYNIDLTTGLPIGFFDLFTTSDEVQRAAEVITSKIAQEPDWYFIDQFSPGLFSPEQKFYLTPDQVVLCFDLYEIAPYASGFPEFPVAAR